MKVKGVLRFYFSAESLERAFKNLIERKACNPFADGVETFEILSGIIGEKAELEKLWAYLDAVMKSFTRDEKERLYIYASRREKRAEDKKAEKRLVVKFVRRARRIGDFESGIAALRSYYCLLSD